MGFCSGDACVAVDAKRQTSATAKTRRCASTRRRRRHYIGDMRRPLMILLPLLAASFSAAPAPPKEAEKEPSPARRFLELTKTDAAGRNLVDQVVRQVRVDLPSVPAEFWDQFAKGV